jgi:redox-sensitive bicupin YhaK (pirin superfamily)
MMDQMGEVEYAPGEPKGTAWHPHRGFETVTYMIDGVMDHQDSHGGGGTITNGDTQWMTAGSGILHIEAPPEWLVAKGGLFHGVQLWVNLPSTDKRTDPRYQDIGSGEVALLTSPDAGSLVRVIAGQVGGHAGPGSTHTPMAMVHATLEPGAQLELPWEVGFNALVYVLNGSGTVGIDRQPIRMGQSAALGVGDYVLLQADQRQDGRSPKMDVIVVGGEPIRESIAWAGPFVMNTKAEVIEAFTDFQQGRFGQIPAVHGAPAEVVAAVPVSVGGVKELPHGLAGSSPFSVGHHGGVGDIHRITQELALLAGRSVDELVLDRVQR